MDMEDSILLGLEGLQRASDEKLNPKAIEIGLVTKDEKFRRLTEEEVLRYLERLESAS